MNNHKHIGDNKLIWHNFGINLDDKASPLHFIWLHGWGQTGQSMARLADRVKDQGSHQVFDLPGFGQTPRLGDDAGTEDYADSLMDQMSQVRKQGKKVVLIGHSFGGRIAVQVAARYSDSIEAIILIAAAGLPRRRSIIWHIRAMGLKAIGKLGKISDQLFNTNFTARYRRKFGSSDYKNAGALRQTFVKTVNENLTRQAQGCRCPALILYGAQDTETPPELGRKFERLIPISRLEIIEGFGHLDILDRGVYQVEAHINSFLKALTS